MKLGIVGLPNVIDRITLFNAQLHAGEARAQTSQVPAIPSTRRRHGRCTG